MIQHINVLYSLQAVNFVNPMPVERSKTIEEMTLLTRKAGPGDSKGKAQMLMARLVDRPANSQALQTANPKMHVKKDLPAISKAKTESASVPNTPSQEKVSTFSHPGQNVSLLFVTFY